MPHTLQALATITVLICLGSVGLSPAHSDPPEVPIEQKLIGMSAPANLWSVRLAEVGACGIEARRIFGDLTADGTGGKASTIEQAVDAGMMPVISYKVPSVSTLNSGGYTSRLTATRNYLNSLGTQVTATFWHEPHGDMTPAQFRQGSSRFLALQSPTIAVGPILNGWLLDNRVADFASYTSTSLLNRWDFVGTDIYQAGSLTNPGAGPARGIVNLEAWMDTRGYPDKPIGVGEYNGYTAAAVAAAGEAILSTPEVWFGLLFNSQTGNKGVVLIGEILDAFQVTKADPRAYHDPAC